MIYPYDYAMLVQKIPETNAAARRVLTRIFLNTVNDSAAYPVDLSEVIELGPEFRSLAIGFLTAARSVPGIDHWEEGSMDVELDYLEREPTHV